MFRPTGFADLAGRRVGVFGYGVEGRATAERLRGVADLVIVDDAADAGVGVLATARGGLEALGSCDVVLKSPGIPRRRPDVLALERAGVFVTSALDLWMREIDRARVVAITGTKGKSTTTALSEFFLRSLGEAAHRLGNFGQPPYDPSVDVSDGWLVLEVSSFQCVDLELAPGVVVVTSLGADHLDWHGSLDQYHRDKLSLTRAHGDHATLVPDVAPLRDVTGQLGGDVTFVKADESGLAHHLGLLGAHSDMNVALALCAAASLTGRDVNDVRARALASASAFTPLPGRLTLVATESREQRSWRFVDDGLATAVLPVLAALASFVEEPLALVAGGFDRGVDYEELARTLGARAAPTSVVCLGPAGARLRTALSSHSIPASMAATMEEAVRLARSSLDAGGVILFSPGAPSFDAYRNWQERSADFTAVAREHCR